jgi:hypothetical protein
VLVDLAVRVDVARPLVGGPDVAALQVVGRDRLALLRHWGLLDLAALSAVGMHGPFHLSRIDRP